MNISSSPPRTEYYTGAQNPAYPSRFLIWVFKHTHMLQLSESAAIQTVTQREPDDIYQAFKTILKYYTNIS